MSTPPHGFSIHRMEEEKRQAPDAVSPNSGEEHPLPQVSDPQSAAHLEPAPQESFSRHGLADVETLQLRRALRTLRRHWLLILLVTALFPLLMHVYDVHLHRLLGRLRVPAWAHLGARKIYAASVTFKLNRFLASRSTRIVLPRLNAEDLRMLPGLDDFREILHASLLDACRERPDDTRLIEDYIRHKGAAAGTALSLSLSSENTGVVRATGPNPRLLVLLVNSFTPALNRYVRKLQKESIDKSGRELRELIKRNNEKQQQAWRELDELNLSINRELDRKVDPELNGDELRRERHELRKAKVKLGFKLSQLEEANDYDRLAAKFYIKTPKDIDQVMIEGNPLRVEWARLEQELVRLRMKYTDEHPRIVKIETDIAAIKEQLHKHGNVTSLGRVPPIPSKTEAEVLKAIAALHGQLKLNQKELEYVEGRIKQADVHTRQTHARLSDQMQAKERRRGNLRAKVAYLQTKNIKLINDSAALDLESIRVQRREAATCLDPSKQAQLESPRYWVDLTMALILGLILGCGLAFLHASMDNFIHTPADVFYHLRLNYLGVIPYWRGKQPKLLDPNRPISGIAEVYAHLCNNIRFGRALNPEKRLLIASAVPREGKSTISVNLAIRYALEGNSVLLIDTDMRRPQGKKILEEYRDPEASGMGLSDFLSGKVEAEKAIQSTKVRDLYFMAAGSHPKNPTNLLRKPILPRFLAEMEERFDVVILDCPALLPVVDATILAPYARGVLLVIAAGEVEIPSVRMTLHRLRHVGAPIIGAALNKVREKNASYGYYGYYGSRRYHYTYGRCGTPEPDGV